MELKPNKLTITLRAIANRVFSILFGHYNYKKFVIISRSRTGSTLLMSLLDSHPNVECSGEIFKNLNDKNCHQIWSSHFGKYRKQIKQVGFRLFYYHPFDEDKSVWDFLKKDKSITVIHLTRNNMLRTLASQKIGSKTKIWTQKDGDVQPVSVVNKQISLSKQECLDFFKETSQYEEEINKVFNDRNLVKVNYEELTEHSTSTTNYIFEKLSVPTHQSISNRKKQNPEPLAELITNYAVLKAAFKGSEFEAFFES